MFGLTDVWDASHLIDKRTKGKKVEYLVEWMPLGTWPPSWEPLENVSTDLVSQYEESLHQ